MVPGGQRYGQRIKPGFGRLPVPQTGSCGYLVEDLDHLGPQAALKFANSAEHVLSGYPALLVGRGSQRHVNMAFKHAVPGLHAIPCRPDIRHLRGHAPVHMDRFSGSQNDAGGLGQFQ